MHSSLKSVNHNKVGFISDFIDEISDFHNNSGGM